jgi:hypothetical protein
MGATFGGCGSHVPLALHYITVALALILQFRARDLRWYSNSGREICAGILIPGADLRWYSTSGRGFALVF